MPHCALAACILLSGHCPATPCLGKRSASGRVPLCPSLSPCSANDIVRRGASVFFSQRRPLLSALPLIFQDTIENLEAARNLGVLGSLHQRIQASGWRVGRGKPSGRDACPETSTRPAFNFKRLLKAAAPTTSCQDMRGVLCPCIISAAQDIFAAGGQLWQTAEMMTVRTHWGCANCEVVAPPSAAQHHARRPLPMTSCNRHHRLPPPHPPLPLLQTVSFMIKNPHMYEQACRTKDVLQDAWPMFKELDIYEAMRIGPSAACLVELADQRKVRRERLQGCALCGEVGDPGGVSEDTAGAGAASSASAPTALHSSCLHCGRTAAAALLTRCRPRADAGLLHGEAVLGVTFMHGNLPVSLPQVSAAVQELQVRMDAAKAAKRSEQVEELTGEVMRLSVELERLASLRRIGCGGGINLPEGCSSWLQQPETPPVLAPLLPHAAATRCLPVAPCFRPKQVAAVGGRLHAQD